MHNFIHFNKDISSETEVWTQMVSTELPALAGHAVAVSYVKSTPNGLLHFTEV